MKIARDMSTRSSIDVPGLSTVCDGSSTVDLDAAELELRERPRAGRLHEVDRHA